MTGAFLFRLLPCGESDSLCAMTILLFLLVLSVLVLIHELGHYLAARAFGVKAEEFGFGFPPRAIGWVRERGKWKRVSTSDRKSYTHTIWSLNWLPFGGFVRLKGEQPDGLEDADAIHAKPVWQRAIIIVAGVLMNWALAIVLFTIIFSSGTTAILEDLPQGAHVSDQHILVTQVLDHSPAAQAGIMSGDVITRLDGSAIADASSARAGIQAHGETPVTLLVRHDGTETQMTVTPTFIQEIGRPAVGVGLADAGTVSFPLTEAFVQAVRVTASLTVSIVYALGDIVRQLATAHQVPQDVSGPVGIAVMTGQVAREGWAALLSFAAMLSVNLAVINFLPIPALDGGRILFLIIEKIRRRPVSRTLEIGIHNIAFLLLIILILLVTAHDLSRYSDAIVGGIRGVTGL